MPIGEELKYPDRIRLLVVKLQELLSDNILERYSNTEYWDWNVAEGFFKDEKLSQEEIDAVTKSIRR